MNDCGELTLLDTDFGVNTELTHGGLFSGILGFSEGFRRAGIRSIWECEWDKKCQDVIRRREPSVKIHDDVTTFNADEFECPDVITFGFPCTDISIAGKRKGVIDGQTRSGLFYEATRIIARFVPRGLQFAIAENVDGLFSHDEGRTFARVLGTLGELGALDIAWATLDSQWFGLAQRRKRVFIVVDFRGERAGEILSLADGLCWHPAPRRQTRERASADAETGIGASCLRGGYDVAGTLGGGSKSGGFGSDTDRCGAFIPEVSGTLGNHCRKPQRIESNGAFIPELAHTLRKEHDGAMASLQERDSKGADSSCDKAMVIEQRSQDAIGFNGAQNPISESQKAQALVSNPAAMCVAVAENQRGELVLNDETFGTLSNGGGKPGQGFPCVAFQQNQSGDVYESEVVGALNTNQNASGRGTPKVMTQYRVRRLTPTECSRLQGFPDDWNSWLSDSARYAQFGNAVSVPVAEWIGRQVSQSAKAMPKKSEKPAKPMDPNRPF